MIDTENLRTASLYINNQLLSRGLLRDGQNIDFASLALDDSSNSEVTVRIVSVLNDLILRRDRDAEHRESLSATMRNLRAENLKHTNDITRLTEKHADAKRKLEIAEASEASIKTQMKSADAQIRGLKEELARTKTLVAQARSTCATDVRRRDRQIDTLKKQLGEAGRARGSRGNSAVISITVTGDIGSEKPSPTRTSTTTADGYDLRNETNSFLAKLAQSLSEENEGIVRLMRRTMQQLREMSGWNDNEGHDDLVVKQGSWEDMATELDSVLEHMRTILTNPSFVPIEEVMVREEEIAHLKDGWVKMEDRWTEAVHLIDGWRKRMAANGRPVCDEELQMGLRLSPVRVKDVEETRQAPAPRLSAVAEESEEELEAVHSSPCPSARMSPGLRTVDVSEQEDSEIESDFDEHIPVDEYDVEEPNVQILQQSTAAATAPFQSSLDASSPLPEPPKLSPLKDSASAGNRGSLHMGKPLRRPGEFTSVAEENIFGPHGEVGRPSTEMVEDTERTRISSASSLDDVLLCKVPSEDMAPTENVPPKASSRRDPESPKASARDSNRRSGPPGSPSRSPRRNNLSRLPLPRNADAPPPQSPLTMATIAAKLAASEREADAVRVRAKLRAARSTRGVKKPTISHSQSESQTQAATGDKEMRDSRTEDVDPIKRDPTPADEQLRPEKRKRDNKTSKTSRTTSRRRSTLSPWELESLMTGNIQ
ncbi:Afadin and alpha-actinin-binding-domain-containing protein [Mariannaea sp. PMI_226]|nr:Afadin and alpha-actinin-binding-domain-containing protein [Mariannaea sp. PMI_226]